MAQIQHVGKRQVFYIPGYDPLPPRRYRELYRSESTEQARISDYQIGIKPLADGDDGFGWMVGARIDGQPVVSRFDVLVWADIVRDSMALSIPATYLHMLRTTWIYLTTGTFRQLALLRKGPVLAALYPIVMLSGQALLALIVGWTLGNWAAAIMPAALGLIGLSAGVVYDTVIWISWALGWAVTITVITVILRWFKARDGRLYAYYLMQDYAFTAKGWGRTAPELASRLTQFQTRIAAALRDDLDEVLIVGHSSGAHLAITALANLLRDGDLPKGGPKLALLTLGQVVPMISFLPKAHQLRADLAYLSTHDALCWVDVTAPGDGCCFAMCDPVAVTGVAPSDQRWPTMISAAFSQSLSPDRWQALRWRFFRLHFQYLCAFDQPKDYDYFQITAGPVTLADRYKGRKPSASLINVPVSRHTNISP